MSESNLPEPQADEQDASSETHPVDANRLGDDPDVDQPQPFTLEEFHAEQKPNEPDDEPTVWWADRRRLRFEFSRFKVSAQNLDTWCQGKLIALDDSHDVPVSVYVDETLLARGELVSQHETIGVRITELCAQHLPEAA
jgi:flagellar motor switch/type III secretory pathway protein FliN